MKSAVRKEIEKSPRTALLTGILLFTMVFSFVGAILQHNWILMLLTLTIAIMICLPRFIGKWSNIVFPESLETFLIIFLYATLFLGELKHYYTTYWWWDVLLHASSGLAFGIIGFIILYIFYKTNKIETGPKMVAMFLFTFALATGALWEIVEFTIDQTFGTTMQSGRFYGNVIQSGGLLDTMKDLIDDSIGALAASIIGYLYLKREADTVKKTNIPVAGDFKDNNPWLFKNKKKKSK